MTQIFTKSNVSTTSVDISNDCMYLSQQIGGKVQVGKNIQYGHGQSAV